ncbi:hypothetical protein SAMN05421776_108219 [Nocardia farcinica]|uniref:Uncharacterized protein n=1 Tax=Nocardia farcinica TaxID=37329 RepID=A0A0H5NE52_NOCFR|nr:hypothetical protein [Nocardia farcinica]AXK88826.1 hypothetical protein DXT66_27230 [Nocardia farcinica]MBA4858073.1 hypothetical protein [Nocardia farcinica]MBC9819396.1 hypothetical protein [Nocardia farcinica]PFX04057.1 hypothetical protein CJ469_01931 [Nocardia farcinica]PFX10215.1 hypothetical protein CJ468_01062 [Nocardia farcinica]
MSLTMPQFEELVELIEQMITARNIEEYRLIYPDWEPPPVPYAELKVTTFAAFEACLPRVHAAVATTGQDGRAAVAFPELAVPVVSAVPAGVVAYSVVVESVSSTGAVVRVLDGAGVGVAGVDVHVSVTGGA